LAIWVNLLGNERGEEGNPYKAKNVCWGAADGSKNEEKVERQRTGGAALQPKKYNFFSKRLAIWVNLLGNERGEEGDPYKAKNVCWGAADGSKNEEKVERRRTGRAGCNQIRKKCSHGFNAAWEIHQWFGRQWEGGRRKRRRRERPASRGNEKEVSPGGGKFDRIRTKDNFPRVLHPSKPAARPHTPPSEKHTIYGNSRLP
jgi:hypothetical protein